MGIEQIGDLFYSFKKYVCEFVKRYCNVRYVGFSEKKMVYSEIEKTIHEHTIRSSRYLILKSNRIPSQRRLFSKASSDFGIKIMDIESLLSGKRNLEHSQKAKMLKSGKELMNMFIKQSISVSNGIRTLNEEERFYHPKTEKIDLDSRLLELNIQKHKIKQKIIALAKDIKAIKKSIKESQRKYNSKEE